MKYMLNTRYAKLYIHDEFRFVCHSLKVVWKSWRASPLMPTPLHPQNQSTDTLGCPTHRMKVSVHTNALYAMFYV